MRCPVCGSRNVKSDRPGEYMCNSCLSFFHESQSAWHDPKRTSTERRWPSMGSKSNIVSNEVYYSSSSSSHSRKKNEKSERKTPKDAALIVLLTIFLMPVLVYLGYYFWHNTIVPDIKAKYEIVDEKKEVFISSTDTISKDAFMAQMKQNFNGDIMGMKVNMPLSTLENLIRKSQENFETYNNYDRFDSFSFYVPNPPYPFGAMPRRVSGNYNNSKVLSIVLHYDEKFEHIVVTNLRKWAGKGYELSYKQVSEYNDKVYRIERWVFKNVEITLNTQHELELTITACGVDFDALIQQKKQKADAEFAKRIKRSSNYSSGSYSSSSKRKSREQWYDEQEEEEYDDDYDEEYGF